MTSPPQALVAPTASAYVPSGDASIALAAPMSVRYFKRYKMEIDLGAVPEPVLPAGYDWVAWHAALTDVHANALFGSFHEQIDTVVFKSLGTRDGCGHLIRDVARHSEFVPESTWLITCNSGYGGTIQGIRDGANLGAIQNLGIVPEHRGRGLGEQLLLKALCGFRSVGIRRAILEVTAENERAVKLYRRLGFRRTKTLYKTVAPAVLV